jgi:predicted acylesterase/phospholipase RssA
LVSPDIPRTSKGETKHINLALQGGGAHSAFTWGVFDCPLEGDCISFDGISATRAGAMNATVFAAALPPAIDRFSWDVIVKRS